MTQANFPGARAPPSSPAKSKKALRQKGKQSWQPSFVTACSPPDFRAPAGEFDLNVPDMFSKSSNCRISMSNNPELSHAKRWYNPAGFVPISSAKYANEAHYVRT